MKYADKTFRFNIYRFNVFSLRFHHQIQILPNEWWENGLKTVSLWTVNTFQNPFLNDWMFLLCSKKKYFIILARKFEKNWICFCD